MAHIVKLEILVDDPNQSRVYDSLNELLRNAQSSETGNNIVDWTFDDASMIHSSLQDSLANETYSEGEAFQDWVIYSASEAAVSEDNAGFWSNEYGWTTFNLATRFGGCDLDLPVARNNDAVLILAKKFAQ